MADKPYHDYETLDRLYNEQGLNQSDIADKFDVSRSCIAKWMDKLDVETRPSVRTISDKRLYDEDWLREKYYGEKLSAGEIADLLDCEKSAVYNQMDKRGMERRSKEEGAAIYHRKERCRLRHMPTGHIRVAATVDRKEVAVGVHRLVAIANGADPHEIFNGKHVHHKNGVAWDNRPENLEVLSNSEHISKHIKAAERSESGEIISHGNTHTDA